MCGNAHKQDIGQTDKKMAPSHAFAHSQTCNLASDWVCPKQIEGDFAAQAFKRSLVRSVIHILAAMLATGPCPLFIHVCHATSCV